MSKRKKSLVGLKMSWSDSSPDTNGDVNYPILGHVNPMRTREAKMLWEKNLNYLKGKAKMRWKITVTGVYDDPRGRRCCPVDLIAKCTLEEIKNHVGKAVCGVMERGNRKKWLHADFEVMCVG